MSTSEKALIGGWSFVSSDGGIAYDFENDGTFTKTVVLRSLSPYQQYTKGSWRESGGTIYMTNLQYQKRSSANGYWQPWSAWMPSQSATMKYSHGTNDKGKYIVADDVYYYKT